MPLSGLLVKEEDEAFLLSIHGSACLFSGTVFHSGKNFKNLDKYIFMLITIITIFSVHARLCSGQFQPDGLNKEPKERCKLAESFPVHVLRL